MNNKDKTINVIGLIVAIASLTIPVASFLITAPEDIKIQSLILFGIMAVATIIFSVVYIIYSGYRRILRDMEDNRKEVHEIKKSLNLHDLFNAMDVRLKVVEKLLDKKNKRAQIIDPRIIWIIIMLILLYLFLKSVGVLP